MQKLIAGLISLSLMCATSALAQEAAPKSYIKSNFPQTHGGFLQFPPHFQPRPTGAIARVSVAPPLLPSYSQPAIPEDGDLWMPGFWAWRDAVPDYYWVPGTWVKPPRPGLLWTPPYWSFIAGRYAFHAGYWAAEVGFYGGIDYGFGYSGDGYQGGHWQNDAFFYNRAANNLGSVNIAHAYDQAIVADGNPAPTSFDGGSRGTKAQPTEQQEELANGQHVAPTAEQQAHFELAAKDRWLYSKLNHGEPGVAATAHVGVLTGSGIVRSSALLNGTAQPAAVTTGANLK